MRRLAAVAIALLFAGAPAGAKNLVFSGALAGATVHGLRSSVTAGPDGLTFVSQGPDPQIIIDPRAPIDPKKTSRFVVTIMQIDVPKGGSEFALFYRTKDRGFDGAHFLYATRWEDLSPDHKRNRLTYVMRGARDWESAPITELRYDPLESTTGQVRIESFAATN